MKIKALTLALLVSVSPAYAMEDRYQGIEDPSQRVKRKRNESSAQKKDPQAEKTDEKGKKKSRVAGSGDQTDSLEEEEITSNDPLLERLIMSLSSMSFDNLIPCLDAMSNVLPVKEIKERCDKICALQYVNRPGGFGLQCSTQDILNYGMGRHVLSLSYEGVSLATEEALNSFCDILKTVDAIKSLKLSGLNLGKDVKIPSSLKLVFQTLATIKVEELDMRDWISNKAASGFLTNYWPHIPKMKTLKKLTLLCPSNKLPEQIFKDLRQAELPLSELNVEAMDFDKDSAAQLGSWIAGSSSLKRIEMINATFTLEAMEFLAMGIGRNPNFESFDVTDSYVTSENDPNFTRFSEILLKQPKIITGLKLKEENSEEGTSSLTASLSVKEENSEEGTDALNASLSVPDPDQF